MQQHIDNAATRRHNIERLENPGGAVFPRTLAGGILRALSFLGVRHERTNQD